MPEEQADRQAASSSGESDTGSEDDGFPRVPTQKNPWPNVNDQASVQAWILWDDEQDKIVRAVESHQYTPGAGLPPYLDVLKDLSSRMDFKDNDASPRTFEPQMKHWQEFDGFVQTLQAYASGREAGFFKTKVPKYVSTKEALSAPIRAEPITEEVAVLNHKIRLDPLHKHANDFNVTGIYHVKTSNPTQASTGPWRVALEAIDRRTLREEGELPSSREWAQEAMLALPGRHQTMTGSFDNEGKSTTDQLRAELGLINPNLPALKGNLLSTVHPKTYIHLAANAGVTRPLRTSQLGAYSLYYLHRGSPVSWTVVDPREYPRVGAFVHCATHTFGPTASTDPAAAGQKRPRKPPQCTASANHQNVYISHQKLSEWDVGWTAFEQFAGDLVVLGPFAWAQYYTNEAGVMEEGVYGDANWKEKIVGKGLVKQCSNACAGRRDGVVDFRTL
ncbi:MAG: hypothetical protein L6R39_000270 [Caloplaca ligustica]|nr:MAG: hypothetical protein L6R39_000270 [Caloplaca ligustica]